MHTTHKCEACLYNRMVISNLIMININHNSLIIINICMNECICVNQTWDFENLKIGQHDLKIDQFSDQS